MQIKKFISLLLLIAVNNTIGEKFSYEGYHFIRLKPNTSTHIDYLKASEHNLDVISSLTYIYIYCYFKLIFKSNFCFRLIFAHRT